MVLKLCYQKGGTPALSLCVISGASTPLFCGLCDGEEDGGIFADSTGKEADHKGSDRQIIISIGAVCGSVCDQKVVSSNPGVSGVMSPLVQGLCNPAA